MLLTLTMNVGLGLQNLKNSIRLGLKRPLLLGWGWPLLFDREACGLLAVGAVGASARGHLAVTIFTEPAGASVAN
jgi:hypothetical protein